MKKVRSFETIQVLTVIVTIAILLVVGGILTLVLTRNAKVNNIKTAAGDLIKAAKNAYATFSMEEGGNYIVSSDNGHYKGMCISVKGLEANGYIDDSYKSYDGYIVIEYNDGEKFYSVWLTNKEFTIDGYEEGKLDKLSYGKGINNYANEVYESKVTSSFTGTTSDHGGSEGNGIRRYETACIEEKIK